ncbi:hypothetical protein BDB00DRAFT_962437 [Zychaea mexicana]|uniref:uncharacterized protein n=1 Tax=Zychaea mexicana TaxID=64656 RepID=UPI0022FEEDF4|nr:uncharacterized protein BDB00DRAFT_962437 [Zychaea mexicana]KAI9489345.1 hypothetical protein BDB00DRAFT_962437 [Zychaea mexicana]
MDTLSELDKYLSEDSKMSLKGMATTLAINFGIAFGIFMLFSILRPNHSLVYAPRYKYAKKTAQPPAIPNGIFSWFRPVMHTDETTLITMIGYDAVMFIRFMRMLRKMLYKMTALGLCIMVINIVATSYTGEWPPSTGVDFLSISTINYYDGKFHSDGNLGWYWAHSVGSWLVSFFICQGLLYNYREYVKLRRDYFDSDEYERSVHSRTLLVYDVPTALQSDEALSVWVKRSIAQLKFPPQEVRIGRRNDQLAKFVDEHESAVRNLENTLSKHLKEHNDDEKYDSEKRPMIRINGRFFGCCGGRKVDAIAYYTERIQTLSKEINILRSNMSSNKPTSYGWISFEQPFHAHMAAQAMTAFTLKSIITSGASVVTPHHNPRILLAPQPRDILWNNLSKNPHLRRSKRLVGGVIFYGFVFLFFIPSSLLSASTNVKDIARIFPDGNQYVKEHSTFVSLLAAWFSPIIMALFFFILPKILRLLSQQQGYLTQTSVDRQVLSKLYIFFIVNHLLVFTIASTLLAMYAQIHSAVQGTKQLTPAMFFTTMAKNLTQVAKNISDVSTYWVNYVSLKGLGVIMDLAQVFALITITLRKLFMNPSPRQLQEFTRPSPFDYALFYNILIFFFTIGLVYSVIAPLVLPFTLAYFLLATMVFKYLLMYVFTTDVDTGGQIWRVLVNRILVSSILFQVVMILVLNFKGATGPAYAMIPLPVFTVLFKFYCRRTFDPHVYYIQRHGDDDDNSNTTERQEKKRISERRRSRQKTSNSNNSHFNLKHNIQLRFGEPSFLSELPIPMVHERVRHLLPKLYGAAQQQHGSTTSSSSCGSNHQQEQQEVVHTSAVMTRRKTVRRMATIRLKQHQELQFQSVTDQELEKDESTEGVKGLYKFDQDDDDEVDDNDDADVINNTDDNSNQQKQQQQRAIVTANSTKQDDHVLRETAIAMPVSVATTTTTPRSNSSSNSNNKRFISKKNVIPDKYAPTRPLMQQQQEEEEDYDFEDTSSTMYATALGSSGIAPPPSHHNHQYHHYRDDGDTFELEERFVAGGRSHR